MAGRTPPARIGGMDTPPPAPVCETVLIERATRFPNLVVALDGAVLLSHGGSPAVPPPPGQRLAVRRSADGGISWDAPATLQEPAIQGGGMLVDERSGAVLCFAQPHHPHPRRPRPAFPAVVHRSDDHGRTWRPLAATFLPDALGNVPALHMAEHGIALRHGPRAGRLLRAARVYDGDNHLGEEHRGYNTAIFSDDGGLTWQASAPFPDRGTGEGAVAELADGTVLYSSRKQYVRADEKATASRWFARSRDGGETWVEAGPVADLPDGPRHRGPERRGLAYNGHYGILAGLASAVVDGRQLVLYSSPDHHGHERVDLVVWLSLDGGRSWPHRRRVHAGPSGYSSLAIGRPGTPSAGWLYAACEGGDRRADEEVRVVRFTLAWLLAGDRAATE